MFLSKRRGYWYVFLEDEHGKRRTVSTRCKLKGDAIHFLASFRESDLAPKPELKNVTLQEFSASYLQWARSANTKKTVQGKESALRAFTRIVGNLPLQRIGVQDIDNSLSQKTVEASVWTARKYSTALAAIFETAARWEHLGSNPFRKINKPRVPELIPRFFSRSEFQQLLQAIDSPLLWGLVVCAVSTGMRLGELLSLHWGDIDFSTRVVVVRNRDGFTTKSKRNRVIPLTEALKAMLLERSAAAPKDCNLVFPYMGREMKADHATKWFKRTLRRTRLDDRLHFHSLRHTFAGWLVQNGASLYEVQRLLGHSNAQTTMIYAHLQPEAMHQTVDKIDLPLCHLAEIQ